MNVTVIGLGYIGLPTAALLAEGGHQVMGFDADPMRREEFKRGLVSTGEDTVKELAERALRSGKLCIVDALLSSDAYILCVPTPTVDGKPVLSHVEDAACAVAAVAPQGAMIVLESTVPPGTTERILINALRRHAKAPGDFRLAHCPERVLPGAIVKELRTNARVIGGRTPEDASIVRDLYASFCQGEMQLTSMVAAEFVKVIENTYRDVNIAFANELSILAEEVGVDVWESIALANRHPRVQILTPGPGVGGHCIPVDPYFLSNANPFVTELIQSARRVNERMPHRVVRRICDLVPFDAIAPKIALLGAAYKADVDDARESPCERIDLLLRERGYVTAIYDPLVRRFAQPLCASAEEAVAGADAVVLVTAHSSFRELDPAVLGPLMRSRFLVDTRRFFDEGRWRQCGFDTYVLGRPFHAGATALA